MYGNYVEIVGNATADPTLKFTPSGQAVCTFGVAWNNSHTNKSGEKVEKVSFFNVVCWQKLAENVAESVTKGMRVAISGRLDQRSWEAVDGTKRSQVEIVADEVSPSLRWATAHVEKNERSEGYDAGPPREEPPARQAPAPGPGPGTISATPTLDENEPF